MNRSNSGANTNTRQVILDTLLVAAAYGLNILVCWGYWNRESIIGFTAVALVFTMVYLLANKEGYLYNVTMFYYLDRVHRKVTRSFFLAAVASAVTMYYVDHSYAGRRLYVMFLVITYVIICLKIFLYKPFMARARSKRAPRTAFVGKYGSFNKFDYFMEKTSIHIDVLGYIAMHKEDLEGSEGYHYIGCLENLEELIRDYNLDQVYILQKQGDELPFTQHFINLCIDMGVTVRIIVDLYKRHGADSYVSTVGTYPIITYHTISLNVYEQVIKRIMDIIGGLVGVILSSPIMLITAIAIKLDSPGPVIFKQIRVGQNGRRFKIYKFRSMYIDAEERKKELMAFNEVDGGVMFKMKDDPRITRVGKIIRKLSIDELPQFFNIVGGSMSLVGTRPPTLDEVEKYQRKQWRRISIKPGLTGMWQVSGRSNIDNFDEIVELDVKYIDNWSLLLDIEILFKTVAVILTHKDAY